MRLSEEETNLLVSIVVEYQRIVRSGLINGTGGSFYVNIPQDFTERTKLVERLAIITHKLSRE